MFIDKNGKNYEVRENKKSWTVSMSVGIVSISYNIPKEYCQTVAELKEYIAKSELF